MRTIKRNIPNIDTSLDNYSKYFNQMEFKGIIEDDNIYTIEQTSMQDAKNVYVNDEKRLSSRPTLQEDSQFKTEVSEVYNLIKTFNYKLVEVKYVSSSVGTIYVLQAPTDTYTAIIHLLDKTITATNLTVEQMTKYHLSMIEHYVICFNDKGAKVFDTNDEAKGWQDLENFVDIPVTKVVVGNTVTTRDKNQFTGQYKEQYIWSNKSQPILPSGDTNVEILRESNTILNYDVSSVQDYTDYKIYNKSTSLNINDISTAYNSVADKQIVAILNNNHLSVSISFDGGFTFINIPYPDYGELSNYIGGALTRDGLYFCLIATTGVYFCNLGDYTWSVDKIDLDTEKTILSGTLVASHFKTRDIYTFVIRGISDTRIYFKGPSLYMGTDVTKDKQLSYISKVNVSSSTSTGIAKKSLSDLINRHQITNSNQKINISSAVNNGGENILVISLALDNLDNKSVIILIYGGTNMWDKGHQTPIDNSGMFTYVVDEYPTYQYSTITSCQVYDPGKPTGDIKNYLFSYEINGIRGEVKNNVLRWYKYTTLVNLIQFELPSIGLQPAISSAEFSRDIGGNAGFSGQIANAYKFPPILLAQGYLYYENSAGSRGVYLLPYNESTWNYQSQFGTIPNVLYVEAEHDKYYIARPNEIITNQLLDSEQAIITYSKGTSVPFTKVPDTSYADTELYLSFGNLLQITANNRDDTNILFNLPTINDQSFIDNITAMVNISTTEVALFFLNKIVICSKKTDSTLDQGYRYDYYNTKLSTGVRLGDSVINTLEGSYTVFATKRGLAAMNYQAFMATTDQVVTYLTDAIKNLWNKFYDESSMIRIMQFRNRLLLTNGTGTILLYDLEALAWWKWEVPVNVLVALSNQVSIQLINTTLLVFKEAERYYDFGEIGSGTSIDWYVRSQPLHMNAPNYYKNLKQIIFQLYDKDETIKQKSMNAQIKLYRKKITLREPETIQFKIEELRTFVKRFNYWKINEVQWGLGSDANTSTPAQLEFDGISIKYELGEEVR